MSAQPKFRPAPRVEVKPAAEDPAGLDKLILALCKTGTRFLEGFVQQKTGRSIPLWDGKDGLGAVLEEQVKVAGIPNKRLPELVTPRAVLQQTGVLPAKRKRAARRVK
jgi:hypothetical protein